MKLSGVTKMVKRQLVCNVFHNIKSDDFYIGTASAIYCATGFPLPLNRSQMGALLGISEDTMIEKVVYNDFDCAYKSDLEGFNLDDTVKGEVEVKKMAVGMDAVEQCFDRFDRTHIVTAEQVLLQYCGMIEEEAKEAAPEIHSETERKWISNQEVIIKQAGIIETQRNMIASLKEENEHLSIAFADERAETNSLRKKLQKKKKHRSLGDRLLQLVGFVYWIVDTICN